MDEELSLSASGLSDDDGSSGVHKHVQEPGVRMRSESPFRVRMHSKVASTSSRHFPFGVHMHSEGRRFTPRLRIIYNIDRPVLFHEVPNSVL